MNKPKSVQKKVFVRNTEQALPVIKVSDSKTKVAKREYKTPRKDLKKSEIVNASSKFDDPRTQSTQQISQKIKMVQNIKTRKSTSDIDKNNLMLADKITKQVNFPYEQPIYKDLIPLCIKMQSQPLIVARDPLPLKDKEPVLSDFLLPTEAPEYTCQASSHVGNKGQMQQFKGLKLYSVMQNWN